MLIAGTTQDVWYPFGHERVGGIHFEPKPTDKTILFCPPPGWHGPTLDSVASVINDGAKIVPVTVGHADIIWCWGTGNTHPGIRINSWAAVQRSSNQTASLRALGDLAPLTWDNYQEAVNWLTAHNSEGFNPDAMPPDPAFYPAYGYPWLVAKKNHGSHGRGKEVLDIERSRSAIRSQRYSVFQMLVLNRTEWRVHVFKGKTISALRKEVQGTYLSLNLKADFKFSRVNVIPKAVSWMAQEAAQRVGLDFAGVDIIRDDDTERFYVLETNSAPGMSDVTIRRLYMHIQHEFGV